MSGTLLSHCLSQVVWLRFTRCVSAVASHGGRSVVLEVQEPLKRLAAVLVPDMNVLACGEALPTFDLHAPFMTLPQACGMTPNTIPWAGPYLEPAVELIATWARELPSPKKLRVGIVWAGNATQSHDRFRSLALSSLHDMISLHADRLYQLAARVARRRRR